MEIRLRKNSIEPKELILIKKALLCERTAKTRKDKKQKSLVEDETITGRRTTANND